MERIKELTQGVGADAVLECVGTAESMKQAIGAARPGGYVSYVGVPHGVQLEAHDLFFRHVHLHGGPAPVRRYLPRLIELIESSGAACAAENRGLATGAYTAFSIWPLVSPGPRSASSLQHSA